MLTDGKVFTIVCEQENLILRNRNRHEGVEYQF